MPPPARSGKKRVALDAIAKRVMEVETLDAEEFYALLRGEAPRRVKPDPTGSQPGRSVEDLPSGSTEQRRLGPSGLPSEAPA